MKISRFRCMFVGIVVVCLTVSVLGQNEDNREQCTAVDQVSKGLNCSFKANLCGWQNAEDNDYDWKQSTFTGLYAGATAETNKSAGSKARLESHWLCPTVNNSLSLQFQYLMGPEEGRCRLTVYLKTTSGTLNVLTKTNDVGQTFVDAGPVFIICSEKPYKIIFEAEKLTDQDCGNRTKGVIINNTVVHVVSDIPASAHLCPFSPASDVNGGLSDGAVAGIVVAAVAVAVIVIVVVSCLLWRYKNGNTAFKLSRKFTLSGNGGPKATTNPAFSRADESSPGPASFSEVGATPITNTAKNPPEAYPYYCVPSVYTPKPYTPFDSGRDEDGYELVIIKPQPADVAKQTDSRGKGDHPQDYDRLSFVPAQVVRPQSDALRRHHVYESRSGPNSYSQMYIGTRAAKSLPAAFADYDHLQNSLHNSHK